MALTGFRLALANPSKIKVRILDASMFSSLSQKYSVRGVPRTILTKENSVEFDSIEGKIPEEQFIIRLKKL